MSVAADSTLLKPRDRYLRETITDTIEFRVEVPETCAGLVSPHPFRRLTILEHPSHKTTMSDINAKLLPSESIIAYTLQKHYRHQETILFRMVNSPMFRKTLGLLSMMM